MHGLWPSDTQSGGEQSVHISGSSTHARLLALRYSVVWITVRAHLSVVLSYTVAGASVPNRVDHSPCTTHGQPHIHGPSSSATQ